MSLYGNLFRYRERENWVPLENFLTEALADLLNRMRTDEVIGLVSDLMLGQDIASRDAWARYVAGERDLRWITQKSIDGGRLDLLLEVDGVATLIVENKIGAEISSRKTDDDDDEEESVLEDAEVDIAGEQEEFDDNQLMKYGRWLCAQRRNEEWSGALVLLTLRTPPPANFGRGARAYGVAGQSVCSWRALCGWLKRKQSASADDSSDDAACRMLCRELMIFLEENNMGEKSLTQRDIAAVEISLSTWGVMNELRKRCGEAVKEIVRNNGIDAGKLRLHDDYANREFGAYVYLEPPSAPAGAKWFLLSGIHFPEGSHWPETVQPHPDRPHVYVWIGGDNSPLPKDILSSIPMPDNWHITGDEIDTVLFATRPLHEFPTKAGKHNEPAGIEIEEITEWVRERVRDIAPVVKKLV